MLDQSPMHTMLLSLAKKIEIRLLCIFCLAVVTSHIILVVSLKLPFNTLLVSPP